MLLVAAQALIPASVSAEVVSILVLAGAGFEVWISVAEIWVEALRVVGVSLVLHHYVHDHYTWNPARAPCGWISAGAQAHHKAALWMPKACRRKNPRPSFSSGVPKCQVYGMDRRSYVET